LLAGGQSGGQSGKGLSALSDVEPDKKSASARAAKIFKVVFMGLSSLYAG